MDAAFSTPDSTLDTAPDRDNTAQTSVSRISAFLVAEVERERVEMGLADPGTQELAANGRNRCRRSGPSAVYTVRLGQDEVAALECPAAVLGIPPTALAGNFIRIGLSGRGPMATSAMVDRLEDAVAELRAVVP